ncbi:hypothetical protein [Mesorhizobium sp. CN2-181]|uniref:hypothetical protein n=1 Tax=Mesorhizobium yinganensis TaxID=3157707 RepID=UPI0032B72035
MDWFAAIEEKRQALKRLLAMLVAMAAMSGGPTLPRHLHCAILRLLRPAEAAARRLIIVAARGIVVALPPQRKQKPKTAEPLLRGLGIAIVVPRADLARAAAARRAAAIRAARPRTICLPLLDPLPRPFRHRCRHVPAHAAPRISVPGVAEPFSLPPPPSAYDPIDAARLSLRLEALGRALDDLPAQAKRFARWKARRDAAAREKPASGRFWRISPLRTGRPPGGRLSRYDPVATHPRNIREIDEILAHVHALALFVLDSPRSDTS